MCREYQFLYLREYIKIFIIIFRDSNFYLVHHFKIVNLVKKQKVHVISIRF